MSNNAFFTNSSGYHIVNIYDTEHPVEVGYYNTGSSAHGLFIDENYAFIGCSSDGFYLFHMSDSLIDMKNSENNGDDEWYDEPVYLGGISAVIVVVVIVVTILFTQKRNAEYYSDEEYYEDSYEDW